MGLEQLVVVIVLYTITKSKIIESSTRSNKKSWILLIFLIYAWILRGIYLDSKEPNAYEFLEIPRTFTQDEIRETYKIAMKSKHPDKNQSPYAQEEFIALKKYYDLIRSVDSRTKYEKFGKIEETQVLWNSFQFYIGWIIICNSLYFSKIPNSGRNLMCLVVLYMITEVFIMGSWGFYVDRYWLSLTIFEQMQLLKSLFPALNFLLSCMETLKTFELEASLERRTDEFMKNGGAVLYQKLKQTENSGILKDFITKTTDAARKKHSSNDYLSLILLVFIIYMIGNKSTPTN